VNGNATTVDEKSTMVDDHVIHVVHVFLLIESRSKSKIVPRFTNLNENPIDDPNITLELKHMLGKSLLLLLIRPLNLITNMKLHEASYLWFVIIFEDFLKSPKGSFKCAPKTFQGRPSRLLSQIMMPKPKKMRESCFQKTSKSQK
jgi:hypothetical protein